MPAQKRMKKWGCAWSYYSDDEHDSGYVYVIVSCSLGSSVSFLFGYASANFSWLPTNPLISNINMPGIAQTTMNTAYWCQRGNLSEEWLAQINVDGLDSSDITSMILSNEPLALTLQAFFSSLIFYISPVLHRFFAETLRNPVRARLWHQIQEAQHRWASNWYFSVTAPHIIISSLSLQIQTSLICTGLIRW